MNFKTNILIAYGNMSRRHRHFIRGIAPAPNAPTRLVSQESGAYLGSR
ncbi:MAG: hypothetical protein [Olavius algarvensis Gamma 3 endosymbiont]|nr:MAG: hypothetical protein [Olavius algarvensis Gamma 3 endosymbiont]